MAYLNSTPVVDVIKKYQEILKPSVKGNFGRRRFMLGKNGIATYYFIDKLVDNNLHLLEFLRESGLIKRNLECQKCKQLMKLRSKRVSHRIVWVCRNKIENKECGNQRSVRHGSWFRYSKLTLGEVLMLTFHIVNRTDMLLNNLDFSSHTMANWRQFVHEVILDYVEENSQQIGGKDCIVEIDESKFGKRKYNRGHLFEGQWVFGGVERGPGKIFLVAVHNRTKETLIGLIQEWNKPGTTIYSVCWKSYATLGQVGYNHLTVNHSLNFVDPVTNCHTNTIESMWNHLKNTLPTYNRKRDFSFYLASFLYRISCKEEKVDAFNLFLEIVKKDWENFQYSC
ncbi:DDE_Tnp_IS1595 domain-containing protein [Trichonephila clavipes]|nr:DDE_Tnp_IS1595 domain-containing protein [Trichonephila clavipes]